MPSSAPEATAASVNPFRQLSVLLGSVPRQCRTT